MMIGKATQEVFDFYRQYLKEHGESPSYREVGKALGRDVRNVHYHVKRLELAGCIKRRPGYRAVEIKDEEFGSFLPTEQRSFRKDLFDYLQQINRSLLASSASPEAVEAQIEKVNELRKKYL